MTVEKANICKQLPICIFQASNSNGEKYIVKFFKLSKKNFILLEIIIDGINALRKKKTIFEIDKVVIIIIL